MHSSPRLDFPSLTAGIAALYGHHDRESTRLRGAQLSAILRMTPFAMAANVGSSLMVLWAFRETLPRGLLLWAAALLLVAAAGTVNWYRNRHRTLDGASPRALHRATRNAAVRAGVWALMPLAWFPDATPAQQILIASLFTGMLGAGTFMLSPLPHAALAYATIYTASALGALARTGDPAFGPVDVLLCLYAPMVVLGSLNG